jgi:dimeric dUTPase (all-alpha-NTP-PPase superfamily)
MEKYQTKSIGLDTPEAQKQLREFAEYVVEELMEAMNCLRNKPWVKTQVTTDAEHYYEELGDALHFFVELLILSGLSAHDVHKLYMRKNKVNHKRIETMY